MGGSDHISSGVMICTDFIYFFSFFGYFFNVFVFFVGYLITFCLVSCISSSIFGQVPLGERRDVRSPTVHDT